MKNVKNVINMKYERNVGICKLQKLFWGITQADHSLSAHFQIHLIIKRKKWFLIYLRGNDHLIEFHLTFSVDRNFLIIWAFDRIDF